MRRSDKIVLTIGVCLVLATALLYGIIEASWQYVGSRGQWRINRLTHEVQRRDFRHGGYEPRGHGYEPGGERSVI